MTSKRSLRRRAAWSVPVLTAAAVAAAALLPSAASASPHPKLPVRTAAQLLTAVQHSSVEHLSGTIVETARLGLPSLPGNAGAASLSWQTLVSGTHTARVWLDGQDRQRLALLGQLSESDVVRNGRDVWTYASDTQAVGHTALGAPSTAAPEVTRATPAGAAEQALKAIDPSTAVTVDRTARVAGQAAYTLVLTPRDSRSTVRKVLVAIDAAHNLPLRVQVFGAAAAPAFETAFTDVSFAKPAASVFHFSPPKGAKVTTHEAAVTPTGARPGPAGTARGKGLAGPAPTVLGSGWTSVVELPAGTYGAPGTGSASSMLSRLTTGLPNGDRLVQSALVNVLLAKDGRVLFGAVSPAVLQQAASGQLR